MTDRFLALQPNQYMLHFTLINFVALVKRGIRFLIVDVDNTLRPIKRRKDGQEFDMASVELLKQLLSYGTIQGVCLVSNVVLKSAEREDRIRRLAKLLGTEHVVLCCGRQCKPNPWGFKEALRLMGASASETVVIGDQLFTDVKGGNAAGCYTIWTKPLTGDKWYTAWKRLPEAILLLFWDHLYLSAYISAFIKVAEELRAAGHTEFHGYQIAQAHQKRLGEKDIVAFGTLYRILDQMEKHGYLESRVEPSDIAEREERPPRRLYTLKKV